MKCPRCKGNGLSQIDAHALSCRLCGYVVLREIIPLKPLPPPQTRMSPEALEKAKAGLAKARENKRLKKLAQQGA